MYESLLLVHSWFRWAVVIAAIHFFFRSLNGWWRKRPWTGQDNYFIWAFNQLFGYQVLFGFTLWIAASPITKVGFKNPSLILEGGVISFWTLRHPITMILAFGAFHIGKAKGRKAAPDHRFKIYAITLAILLVLIGSAIPWPWLSYGRHLFRWFL